MKKILLFFVGVISIYNVTYSQDTMLNRKFVVGGTLSFSSQDNSVPSTPRTGVGTVLLTSLNPQESSLTSFNISPYLGKHVNDNLLLGISLTYQHSMLTRFNQIIFAGMDTVDLESKQTDISAGIIVRYILNPQNKFNFFWQPYLGYFSGKYSSGVVGDEFTNVEYTGIQASLNGGVIYTVSDKWRFLLSSGVLSFTAGNWDYQNDETSSFSHFGTTISLSSIRLGAEYLF